jgi:hypothetical protein
MRSPSLYKTKAELSSWFCFVIFFVLILASPKAFCGINEWTYVGLAPEEITSLAVHPTNPDILFASAIRVFWDSTRRGGVFRTTDHGLTWNTLGFRDQYPKTLTIDPSNPQTLWVANAFWGAFRSTDEGQTWESRSEGIYLGGVDHFGPLSITVCPYNSDYLLCGEGSDVGMGSPYFTSNAGSSWILITSVLDAYAQFVAYDPSAVGLAYVVTSSIDIVWTSSDTGRTFTNNMDTVGIASYDFKIAPRCAGKAWYATDEHGVQVTIDSGYHWQPCVSRFIGTDTTITSMSIIGAGDTMAFIANFRPYLTYNGGITLTDISCNLPSNPWMEYIWIERTDPVELWGMRILGGLWSYTVDSSQSVSNARSSLPSTDIRIFPNPTHGLLRLNSSVYSANGFGIALYNVLGQRVFSSSITSHNAQPEIQLPDILPNGIYFISINPSANTFPSTQIVTKIVLIK